MTRYGPMSDVTKARLSASQRERHPAGSTYDKEAVFAAVRRHSMMKDAAAELGITPSALQSRMTRLAEAGTLPADILAIRQRNIERPNHNRPKVKPAATSAPKRRVGRVRTQRETWILPSLNIPDLPLPDGPKVVVELPTPPWDMAPPPEPVNEFNLRRLANARERAERTWNERNGGMTR